MARFANTQGSLSDSINTAVDVANAASQRGIVAKTGATTALTAAEMVNKILRQSGANGALNIQLPTAAQILALLPNAQIGSMFEFVLMNTGDNADTLVATGTNITLIGTTSVPANKTQIYRGIVTAVDTPAISLVGLLYAPV